MKLLGLCNKIYSIPNITLGGKCFSLNNPIKDVQVSMDSSWKPPSNGEVKFNVDVAVLKDCTTLAVVIRKESGRGD